MRAKQAVHSSFTLNKVPKKGKLEIKVRLNRLLIPPVPEKKWKIGDQSAASQIAHSLYPEKWKIGDHGADKQAAHSSCTLKKVQKSGELEIKVRLHRLLIPYPKKRGKLEITVRLTGCAFPMCSLQNVGNWRSNCGRTPHSIRIPEKPENWRSMCALTGCSFHPP